MRVGITGAGGFIGSYLLDYLRGGRGRFVRALLRSAATGTMAGGPAVEVVRGDLMSPVDCQRFVRDLDAIVYLAHSHSPATSDRDLRNDAWLNTMPLLNFIEAVRALRTRPHVIYFSSGGAMYRRRRSRRPFRETDACLPCSSYGIQKLMAEHYLRMAAERGLLSCTVLRVGNAYGTLLSADRTQGLIGVAVTNALHGRPVVVFGDPRNVRDYIHLDDVCAACENALLPVPGFSVFNIGTQTGYSVIEVLDTIERQLGYAIVRRISPDTPAGRWLPEWAVLDIGKARAAWNWTPAIDLATGIRGMIAAARRPAAAFAAAGTGPRGG